MNETTITPALKTLRTLLPANRVHTGSSYLYFLDADNVPFTVIDDQAVHRTVPMLVLSADKPGQTLHRFTNVNECARVIKSLL